MRCSPATHQLGPGCSGQAVPYLNGGYPEETNVKHAVGHEACQVQGHEVKA